MFPTDFLRLTWILTPFDLVAAIYLFFYFRPNADNRLIAILSLLGLAPLLGVAALSAVANPPYAFDHVVLCGGLMLSLTKAIAFLDAARCLHLDRLKPMNIGFLLLNIPCVALLLSNSGFSGSGRFYGIFGQSNGLGAFETFSFAIAVSGIIYKGGRLYIVNCVLSLLVLFATGSRGSLISAIAIFLFALRPFASKTRSVVFTCTFLALVTAIAIAASYTSPLLSLSDALRSTELSGFARLAAFVESIHHGTAGESYVDARGVINEAAIAHLKRHNTWLGTGYESSAHISSFDVRVHNIFLCSAIELGLVGAGYFLFVFLIGFIFYVVRPTTIKSDGVFPLLFIGVWLQASKTPFFFLNAVSWSVVLDPLLPKQNRLPSPKSPKQRRQHGR